MKIGKIILATVWLGTIAVPIYDLIAYGYTDWKGLGIWILILIGVTIGSFSAMGYFKKKK